MRPEHAFHFSRSGVLEPNKRVSSRGTTGARLHRLFELAAGFIDREAGRDVLSKGHH